MSIGDCSDGGVGIKRIASASSNTSGKPVAALAAKVVVASGSISCVLEMLSYSWAGTSFQVERESLV